MKKYFVQYFQKVKSDGGFTYKHLGSIEFLHDASKGYSVERKAFRVCGSDKQLADKLIIQEVRD